jgi:predicted membrane protein
MGKRHWLTGFIFIVIGIVLLLNNLGYIDVSVGWLIRNFWPVVLILLGVSFLESRKSTGEMVTGLILIALGTMILGNRQGWFAIDFSRFWSFFWPAILILIGISFLRGPRMVGGNNVAIMSGIEKTKSSWDLEDGTYWAIMGGISLDLNKANLEPGKEYFLSCNALMGGIEITVPEDATVYCQGSVTLGGLEMLGDETGGIFATLKAEQISGRPDAPVIRIHSRAALGGVEIESR